MDADIKAKWIDALRSGKYKRGPGHLRFRGLESGLTHCCLGVLFDMQGRDWEALGRLNISSLPPEYSCGLSRHAQWDLAHLNDAGKSFDEIADYIEANL